MLAQTLPVCPTTGYLANMCVFAVGTNPNNRAVFAKHRRVCYINVATRGPLSEKRTHAAAPSSTCTHIRSQLSQPSQQQRSAARTGAFACATLARAWTQCCSTVWGSSVHKFRLTSIEMVCMGFSLSARLFAGRSHRTRNATRSSAYARRELPTDTYASTRKTRR